MIAVDGTLSCEGLPATPHSRMDAHGKLNS